jgi:hypothetical protein
MNSVLNMVRGSPLLIRVVPFALFLIITTAQGHLGTSSQYWCYLTKVLLGVWMIRIMRPVVAEMRWRLSWEAVVAGVAVFVLWVGIDPFYRKLGGSGPAWNPFASFPGNAPLAWLIVAGRIAGSTLIVPPLEEVFYRSFVYRYIVRQDFLSVPLNHFKPAAFLAAAAVFGFAHREWLAGILCAFAYHGLILRRNRLGDAMTAHAITNFLLGCWVVWKGAWDFW